MPHVVRIALSGAIVLIVAMGIGRFALTPQLPVMLAQGQLVLQDAAWVAAANYLGYFAGALDALATRRHGAAKLRLALLLIVVLTALSGFDGGVAWHALLRFVLGVASAWGLIMVSGWSADVLQCAGRPALGLLVFTGTGAGIALVGVAGVCLRLAGAGSRTGWLTYAVVALLLSCAVWRHLPDHLNDDEYKELLGKAIGKLDQVWKRRAKPDAAEPPP